MQRNNLKPKNLQIQNAESNNRKTQNPPTQHGDGKTDTVAMGNKLRNNNTNNINKTNAKINKNNNVKSRDQKNNSNIYDRYNFNNTSKPDNKTIAAPIKSPRPAATTTLRIQPSPVRKTKAYNSNNTNFMASRSKSIPQATLDYEKKRRQLANHAFHTYEIQQREVEILRQKRILEDMLQEHQILETNRRNIKQEIQSLKLYINEIRDKLDRSLYKLGENKTICSLSQNRKNTLAAAAAALKNKRKQINNLENKNGTIYLGKTGKSVFV